jgi:folate-binding protein YgfZ
MGGHDNGHMSDASLPDNGFDGALRLADWGAICAEGADATSFLHSQLTQDLTHLDERHARLAGYCSPKGRLLATFVVWRAQPGQIVLACSADVLAATLRRLSMFVLRAKCKLSDASDRLALYGLAGSSARTWIGDAAPSTPWAMASSTAATQLVRLPDADGTPRWLLATPIDMPPPLPSLSPDAWSWLEVRSGVPRITAATAEQFVPQMLNLELLGAVSFQKGCYPGQEVIARSQYRGTLKRRTYLMSSELPLRSGIEVFHSADPGQPAGLVVLAASLPDGRAAALVELKIAALDHGELRAGDGEGPRLSALGLPYALEAEST